MIYILIFLISLILLFFGISNRKNKIGVLLIIIGLLLPCFLAGLRGKSVGTDTSGYVLGMFNLAKKSPSFLVFLRDVKDLYANSDYLYLIVTYLSSLLPFGFNIMLFTFEFLIIFPLYKALKILLKQKWQILVALFLFFMTFYNLSLNMVRQSISISFFVLSFAIYMNKKDKRDLVKSILLLICAIESHDIALVSIPIFVLYEFSTTKKISDKVKKYACYGINLLLVFSILFHKPLIQLVGNTIYPKALVYLENCMVFDIDYTSNIINLCLISLIILNKKYLIKQKENYSFWLELSIINFIINFLGTFIAYTYRLSYYSYFLILFIFLPKLTPKIEKKLNIKKNWIFYSMIVCFFAYWILFILIKNNNETIPYIFLK